MLCSDWVNRMCSTYATSTSRPVKDDLRAGLICPRRWLRRSGYQSGSPRRQDDGDEEDDEVNVKDMTCNQLQRRRRDRLHPHWTGCIQTIAWRRAGMHVVTVGQWDLVLSSVLHPSMIMMMMTMWMMLGKHDYGDGGGPPSCIATYSASIPNRNNNSTAIGFQSANYNDLIFMICNSDSSFCYITTLYVGSIGYVSWEEQTVRYMDSGRNVWKIKQLRVHTYILLLI